jgi:NADH:ubiquinone oxidoreductase subunit 3 (subunit A)
MVQSLQFIFFFNYIIIAFVITILLNVISIILNKKTKKNNMKLLNYETGCLSTADNYSGIDIPFFVIGILFLVLDVEIVLLFP